MKKFHKKALFALILAVMFGYLLADQNAAFASHLKIRVLFVGNSLTAFNDMPAIVGKMGLLAKDEISIESLIIAKGGDSLDKVVKRRTSPYSRYSKAIESENWDYVVLQDHSKAPISARNQMMKAVEALVETNQKNKANTLLFMTWAPKEKPHQIAEISMVYNYLGQYLETKVAPVGLVWDAIIKNSNIDPYDSDGIHPNQVGSLLTACTIFTALTNQQCEIPEEDFPNNLSKEEMEYLRKTVWNISTSSQPNPDK